MSAGENDLVVNGRALQKMVRMVVAMAFVTLLALFAAIIAIRTAVQQQVVGFATNASGQLVPAVALDEPYLSESRVLAYADECLRRAFAHDFLHYPATIPAAQECFTPASADLYAQGMQPYIKLMESKRMVMASTLVKLPRVTRAYAAPTGLGTAAQWDIEAQVDLYFEGKGERIPPSRQTVFLTMQRVPLQNTPRGIQISKFNVAPA